MSSESSSMRFVSLWKQPHKTCVSSATRTWIKSAIYALESRTSVHTKPAGASMLDFLTSKIVNKFLLFISHTVYSILL